MRKTFNILMLGASYGSLLATKLTMAGHNATLVCLPAEADLINESGTRVRVPTKHSDELVEIDSREQPGKLSATVPTDVDLSGYDLVALAMQEPQYRADGVRELLDAIAKAKLPCMSIMNMPPLPYLARIPTLDVATLSHCYTDASVWQNFDPALMTLCSPDPQAFRPPDEPDNVLQVTLPTNFKAARFEHAEHTDMLRTLQADIEAVRLDTATGPVELPVKLKVHDSVFVPLAKWSMLLTGNYRCILANDVRPIKEAVHSDLELSRETYAWVNELVAKLGAAEQDQVPFEKYANAALGLAKPSSAARALLAGVQNIERVDCIVRTIATQLNMHSATVDETVAHVEGWLARNRA